VTTTTSITITISEMGTRESRASSAATGTRTWRISSVAYAVDEIASDAKTARAMIFGSSVWCSSADASGRPTTSRLRTDATEPGNQPGDKGGVRAGPPRIRNASRSEVRDLDGR
jgi:hypothetical protein